MTKIFIYTGIALIVLSILLYSLNLTNDLLDGWIPVGISVIGIILTIVGLIKRRSEIKQK